MINIQSAKFHEVKAFDLFTKPNVVLTDILRKEVNIFEDRDILYSFTQTLSYTPEDRIQKIIEHGTPRYYCELYPENHPSYTNQYPVGAFYASENYYYLDIFYNNSDRFGDILLIYDKKMMQEFGHTGIYGIKSEHTYSQALQAVIRPKYGTTSKEAIHCRTEIRNFINTHR